MRLRILLLLLLGLFEASGAGAQVRPPASAGVALESATSHALLELAGQAAVVFAGRVERVDRADASGYVDVRFGVDTAVRGCAAGGVYVLREWAGLWSGREARYAVGQRRLMLLAGRGSSGLSAPVGGGLGAISLVGGGDVPVMDKWGNVVRDGGPGSGAVHVDLRLIAAHAVRGGAIVPAWKNGGRSSAISRPVTPIEMEPGDEGAWAGAARPLPVGANHAGVGPALEDVLTMLRSGAGAEAGSGAVRAVR